MNKPKRHLQAVSALSLSLLLFWSLAGCGGGGGGATAPATGAAPSEPAAFAVEGDGLELVDLAFVQVMARPATDASMRLTADKPALARATVTARRAGVTSPMLTLIASLGPVTLGTLGMVGPATLPTQRDVNALDSTYNVTVPAAWLVPGVSFRASLGAGASALATLAAPTVGRPTRLQVVLVPISVNGVVGVMPDLAQVHAVLARAYPVAAADIVVTQRAPLVISGVTGLRDGDDLIAALAQLEEVRSQENPTSFYYGMFAAALVPAGANLGAIGTIGTRGNEILSAASALGLDATYQFQLVDPLGLRLPAWARLMLHEIGHNHGLLHAPCGGAQQVDAAYPYPGGVLNATMPVYESPRQNETLGRLAATRTATGPMTDVMGYCDGVYFSDYNSDKLQSYAEARAAAATAPMAATRAAQAAPLTGYLVLSGLLTDQGVSFNAPRATSVAPRHQPPGGSDLSLRLSLPDGRVIDQAVTVNEVADGARSARFFSLAMSNPGALASLALLRGGQVQALASPRHLSRLSAPAQAPLAVQARWTEAAGAVHLVWDARREPIVGVTHVSRDGARTVVAPRLEGGEASFSTTGLPAGGHFEVSYASPLSARLALMQR